MRTKSSAGGATVQVWDLPLRLFHWLLVAAIAVAFLSAFKVRPLAPWHQAAGWVAAVLIAFRIVWWFVGGKNARLSAFHFAGLGRHLGDLLGRRAPRSLGHNPLGAMAIVGLLLLAAITIATGALIRPGGDEDLHEAFAYALLALIAVHVAAVAAMSVLTGENLVGAMITGRKPAALHPDASDAREPGVAALLIGAATIAAAAYGAALIDPIAFAPHPAANGQHAPAAPAAGESKGD